MLIAAFVTFGILLVAWLLAPDEPVLTLVEPMAPAPAEPVAAAEAA